MEPAPPKGRKPKHQRPFYEAGRRTSAEIISEARSSVKIIKTSRPFTPLEKNRRLFGSATSRPTEGRPPSAVSIGARSFTDSLTQPPSRPPTGKLTPIDSGNGSNLNELINSKAAEAVEGRLSLALDDKESLDQSHSDVSQRTGKKSAIFTIPSPPLSGEPEVSKTRHLLGSRETSPSNASQFGNERRVQSGPKERPSSPEAKASSKAIRKYNSSGDVRKDSKESESIQLNNNCSGSNESLDIIDKSVAFFRDTITPLLKQMELNYLHSDMGSLSVNFDILKEMLRRGNIFRKPNSSGLARGRAQVLKTVFKFVDVDDPNILVKLCKLAIMMNVTGKNQNNICKILFKISRDSAHDTLLKEEDLIADIITIICNAELSSDLDWLIYAVGALKFLTGNSSLEDELVKSNCLGCFATLLIKIKASLERPDGLLQTSHLLVQITAALRNVADLSSLRKQTGWAGILETLMELSEKFSKDADYVLNLSRILSKLTQYSEYCYLISNDEMSCKYVVNLLQTHTKSQGILVRILFTMGNIAAKVDESRLECYKKKETLHTIAVTCNRYLNKLNQVFLKEENGASLDTEENSRASADVLIKATRFIANISVHASIGPDIGNNEELIHLLLELAKNKNCQKNEELVINVAATFNNISFYADEDGYFRSRQENVCEVLSDLILMSSVECTVEITRVFGNLTRSLEVRQILLQRKFVDILVTLLDSSDRETVFCACGALINMMLEKEAKDVVVKQGGITKLVEALKDFGQTDWQLASMICQSLWNFSDKITSSTSCFGENEVDDLLDTLQTYLEPEIALDYSEYPNMDRVTMSLMCDIWKEQFMPVAQRLYEKIQFHHTDLEPLSAKSQHFS